MRVLGRIIALVACLFQITAIFAQNTASPYSRFGIGELSTQGFDKSRAMGRIGLAMRDNNHLHYLNPASYTALDTLSFLFDFGVNAKYGVYQLGTGEDQVSLPSHNMNIDHIAIGFPFTRWWKSSVGIMPYSSVGYDILEESSVPDVGAVDYLYSGTGGLNKLYLGTAMEFFRHVSLGVNFSYVFGALEFEKMVDFPLDPEYAQASVKNNTVANGFLYSFGIQYYDVFKEDFGLQAGLIFENKRGINAEKTELKWVLFPGEAAAISDTSILEPRVILSDTVTRGAIILPGNLGAGIAVSYQDKFTLGFDYYQQDWSKSSFFEENDMFAKSNSYHLGMEFTPDREAMRGYWKRINYRLGAYSRDSYLQVKGRQLSDSGISFGVGLPIRGNRSSFNLACSMGQRGTLENDLIRERYVFLSFSVTLHDFWFIKRKFD